MSQSTSFFEKQLEFPRVFAAYNEKSGVIHDLLMVNQICKDSFELFLRAFKKEKILEVWAKNQLSDRFTHLKTYEFSATTGILGPKRRSGDLQIPEGFYEIDFFNPHSKYHLSLRINYPNKSDLVFADKSNPGDNIFIHGGKETVGCIPIGDENIKELYLLASKAKSVGCKIQVHIFPVMMNDSNYNSIREEYGTNSEVLLFWSWLKTAYEFFGNYQKLPSIAFENSGNCTVG